MDLFPEAFERFERSDVDISECRDSDDLIRRFRYWIGRVTTHQQEVALRKEARRLGIPKTKRPRITEFVDFPIEKVKRHYTFHKVKGKTRRVARIPKGQKGAGRFAKRY